MGLSKSKVESKPIQPGFPGQPSFSAPGQFQPFTTPAGAFGSQTFPTAGSGFSTPTFSSQTAFPPFPSPVQAPIGGFGNNSLFNQPPIVPSSGFPVSYPGQPFRPLIPGYAPAPGNDRRGNSIAHETQEQNDYTRFFQDQQMGHMMPQVPQMQQGKSRKH